MILEINNIQLVISISNLALFLALKDIFLNVVYYSVIFTHHFKIHTASLRKNTIYQFYNRLGGVILSIIELLKC